MHKFISENVLNIYSLLTVVISNDLQNDLFVIIITNKYYYHSLDCIESDCTFFYRLLYIFISSYFS